VEKLKNMTASAPSQTTDPGPVSGPAPGPVPGRRLISLDAVRGLTIAFMIMVNNNGSEHNAWWFMKHADWNGMTPTDLVFPTFLFVVGASIVFAFETRLHRGATRSQLAWQTVRRAAVLFCFGIIVNNFGGVLNSFPNVDFTGWRIYGVLQRIAICYLITLDSHEYYGPFLNPEDAHTFARITHRSSYQLVPTLPAYAMAQVQQPKIGD